MAGRARTNAILDALDQRRRAHFEDDPDATTLDFITEWVGEGKTVKTLAQQLTDQLHFEVWAETLTRILKRQYGEEAVATALSAARMRASHWFAEDSLDLVDRASSDSAAAVSKASSQARSRQWLAGKYNRKDYGDDKGVSLNVSIGSLHLDALRSVRAEVTGAPNRPILPSPVTQADEAQAVVLPTLNK